jgi:hypothetical protein
MAYNAFIQRIEQPDIAVRSDSYAAWKEVREFNELTRLGKSYIPYVLERLRAGDFRMVPVIECITNIRSVNLYPSPLPPPGQFGAQDVAALWLAQGAQFVLNECKARCSGNTACEATCDQDRQQYWRP